MPLFQFHRRCASDWLMITDGNGDILMDKTCGSSLPEPITTTTSRATVNFRTNGRGRAKGFKIRWVSSVQECPGESQS